MNNRSLILCAAAMLLIAVPVHAEDVPVSDEIMDMWSNAYETEVPRGGQVDAFGSTEAQRQRSPYNTDLNGRSLTPHLDRLMGVSPRSGSSDNATSPSGGSTLGHDTFFENPPMTSKGKKWGKKDKKKKKKKKRGGHGDKCDKYRCRCKTPDPVPEPGTLLLAGGAAAAAIGARRRARRKARENADISD